MKLDDEYLPVNGTITDLLRYQNCSHVTATVTLEENYECQDVSATPIQTETSYGVLLNVQNNGKCNNDKSDFNSKTALIAVVTSVCGAFVFVGVGVVVVRWWRSKQHRAEESEMELQPLS